MNELHNIIGRFNELNRDNGPNVPAEIYGKRESMLRKSIKEYNHGKAEADKLALIQPRQFVRNFRLRGI